MEHYKKLDWESGFFNFPVAVIINQHASELSSVLEQLTLHRYRLAFLFSSPEDSHLQRYASICGGLLADRKVTFGREIPILSDLDRPRINHDQTIRINPADILAGDLFDLAYSAGKYSRFKTDPHFSVNDFERLYSAWVVNSLNGQLADYTIIVNGSGCIEGFSTLKLEKNTAKIGLISVDATKQKQGIGKSLIMESFKLCIDHNINSIEVVTQLDNSEACSFYEKVGFSIKSIKYVYHFWL